ncbi:hypothetical protein I546_0636 [Mycobacterium kansasii 732]|nr:hypothetical protein I546_0636 [Mycobacterium kansasii 732]
MAPPELLVAVVLSWVGAVVSFELLDVPPLRLLPEVSLVLLVQLSSLKPPWEASVMVSRPTSTPRPLAVVGLEASTMPAMPLVSASAPSVAPAASLPRRDLAVPALG